MMKTIFSILILFCSTNVFTQKVINISGTVTHLEKPILNVSVLIKGTSKGSLTDEAGRYILLAKPMDILVFSYLGMQTVEIIVEDDASALNVELSRKVEKLDEVVVKKRRAFTQKELLAEYPFNKNLIKTSRGILDKDRASFSMHIIDGDALIVVGTDFLYSLQNLYPTIQVIRKKHVVDNGPIDLKGPIDSDIPDSDYPKVYLQRWSNKSSPQAIFDVDGFIYEKPPTFLSANDIERVAILLRNGAISRYGPAGAGGVIIINTKSKTSMDDISIQRTYDNSGLRDSLIDAMSEKEIFVPSFPEYMKKFVAANSERKAFKVFEGLKKKYGESPYYYLEVSDYFRTKWQNNKKSGELLDLLVNRFPHDVSALKASAYKNEELGLFEIALETYLKILKLRSKDAQSHRDVANAYAEIGNYKRALNVYAGYELMVSELDTIAFDSYGTDFLMTTESANLIKLKGKELSLDKSTIDGTMKNPSTRLLFEWDQNDVEFEIQIATPEGNYDGWENISKPDNTLLKKEKLKGYSCKQFFLDDGLKGEWRIHMNYLGNPTKNPTYLKATVFFDYGKPMQRKEPKVFKLSRQNTNMHLFTVNTDLNKVVN